MQNVEQSKNRATQTPLTAGQDTLDVLDILIVLASRRRMISIITSTAFFVGLLLFLLLKPTFTATAVILPPQQQSSSAALLGQLGSLAALGGGGSAALGLKTPADMYVGMLQSRTIADNIIAKFNLQKIYKRRRLVDTRASLKANTTIEAGKDGLIQIAVTDHDSNRARDIANAYVDELHNMNSGLAISEAAQRRVFFDQRLDGEKKALATAEENLKTTQQKTGLIQLTGQAQVIIQTIAQLRAEIASREVEMQSLRTFATEQNPDTIRLGEEILTMRQQLAKLENDQQRRTQPGNIAMPAGRVPEDSLEYARKYREVKYHETLFELLSRQYEAARIDEAKSAPIIQVIDHAVTPDKKSGPHGILIIGGAAILGLFWGGVWSFLSYEIGLMRQQARNAARLDQLQRMLHLRFK